MRTCDEIRQCIKRHSNFTGKQLIACTLPHVTRAPSPPSSLDSVLDSALFIPRDFDVDGAGRDDLHGLAPELGLDADLLRVDEVLALAVTR